MEIGGRERENSKKSYESAEIMMKMVMETNLNLGIKLDLGINLDLGFG